MQKERAASVNALNPLEFVTECTVKGFAKQHLVYFPILSFPERNAASLPASARVVGSIFDLDLPQDPKSSKCLKKSAKLPLKEKKNVQHLIQVLIFTLENEKLTV